jgi:hypothetical protein
MQQQVKELLDEQPASRKVIVSIKGFITISEGMVLFDCCKERI